MNSPPTSVTETRLPGSVPRYAIPGWREEFGVVAGVTGRGTDPAAPFDLGLWSRAPVGDTMRRWRAFLTTEPGFPAQVLAHQVHGRAVRWQAPEVGWVLQEGLDGHLTRTPGVLLLVTLADCVPIYLVDPRRRTAALLHSGWRGTVADILARGVEELVEIGGSSVGDIVMHCGVAICGKCYEVGSEVLEAFGERPDTDGHGHLDLRDRLVDRGRSLGLTRISTSQICSAESPRDFFSHRASRGADGRMVAYLGWPQPAVD